MIIRKYSYIHTVSFEETNLVGNVYFANFIKWQGLCREMYLKEFAPDILNELYDDLALITLSCSCDYFEQSVPFDRIRIEMSLKEKKQNRVTMEFEYFKEVEGEKEILIAKGKQKICVMRKTSTGVTACDFPQSLNTALEAFV